jgi:hypothetical protein
LESSKIQGWKPTFECGDSTLKNKPIEVRSHEIQVENSPWNLKKLKCNTWINQMENISNCLK